MTKYQLSKRKRGFDFPHPICLANIGKEEETVSLETDVIFKQLLLQITRAKTLDEARNAIKFLCSKEAIAEAERIVAEEQKGE